MTQTETSATTGGDLGTAYHATVQDFRRDLIRSHVLHWKAMEPHAGALIAAKCASAATGKEATADPVVRDAYTGQMMAAGYAYALAVALELAEQLNPEFAARIASRADCALTNGGEEEYCADVWPPEDDAIRTGADCPAIANPSPAPTQGE